MKKYNGSGGFGYLNDNCRLHNIGLPAFKFNYNSKQWAFNGRLNKLNGPSQTGNLGVTPITPYLRIDGKFHLYGRDININIGKCVI